MRTKTLIKTCNAGTYTFKRGYTQLVHFVKTKGYPLLSVIGETEIDGKLYRMHSIKGTPRKLCLVFDNPEYMQPSDEMKAQGFKPTLKDGRCFVEMDRNLLYGDLYPFHVQTKLLRLGQ